MHLWRPCLALGLLAAFAADAAVVYKWTDADGVIHFSDQAVPGAERIVTSSGSANGIGGAGHSVSPAAQEPPQTGAVGYTHLSIDSPSNDQVFFGDDIVPVRLAIAPALKPNQSIAWHLNGKQLDNQTAEAVSFSLQSLPRGTYVLAATVTDAATGASQTTDSVTFYVRQPSELAPQHRSH